MSWIHFRWNCSADRERDARIEREDRIRALEAEVSDLRGQLAEARRETARAGERVADYLAKKFMREPIFAQDEPRVVSPVIEDVPIPRARRQARDIVREQTLATEAELLQAATKSRQQANSAAVDVD